MAKQNYSMEQIITKLREVEVLCSQGKTVGEAVCQIGVSEQTYYRWRRHDGGMGTAEARRFAGLSSFLSSDPSAERYPDSNLPLAFSADVLLLKFLQTTSL